MAEKGWSLSGDGCLEIHEPGADGYYHIHKEVREQVGRMLAEIATLEAQVAARDTDVQRLHDLRAELEEQIREQAQEIETLTRERNAANTEAGETRSRLEDIAKINVALRTDWIDKVKPEPAESPWECPACHGWSNAEATTCITPGCGEARPDEEGEFWVCIKCGYPNSAEDETCAVSGCDGQPVEYAHDAAENVAYAEANQAFPTYMKACCELVRLRGEVIKLREQVWKEREEVSRLQAKVLRMEMERIEIAESGERWECAKCVGESPDLPAPEG